MGGRLQVLRRDEFGDLKKALGEVGRDESVGELSLYLDVGALLLLRFPFSMSVFLNRSELEHTVYRLASFIEF
jgi:hypothetical protein